MILIHIGSYKNYHNCRLPESINFPMSEFDRINDILKSSDFGYEDIEKHGKGIFNGSGLTFPGFDHPIMLYSDDKDSLVANIAKVYMNKFGFNNICVLEGGLETWKENGNPTISGC
jgi:3-mercaptopyruvate sulfurtransferase SseA